MAFNIKKRSVFPFLLIAATYLSFGVSLVSAQTIVPANVQGITVGSADGIDSVTADFNQSQTTLTKRIDESYELVTPNGTVELYDFEYIYFKDAAVTLDTSTYVLTRLDAPGLQNNVWGDDDTGNPCRMIYYGGNDTIIARYGTDGLSVPFNQSQTTLTKRIDESYELVTPNGTVELYDFEYVYFKDAAVNLADIDSDGIPDIYETNTGTYVSTTNTGTDPNKPDTDGDGLLDGVETATRIYVNPSNTGTNPNFADTDGDGLKDGAESLLVSVGFDPNINNSENVVSLFVNPNDALLYTQKQHNANRTNGHTDVMTNPSAFNLFTQEQFNSNRAAGQSDVINSPMSYGLYTSNSIMDLRMGGLMIQRIGTNAVVSFQPQTTTNLNVPFTNNGTPITNAIPMPGNKGFIRINAKPEQSVP